MSEIVLHPTSANRITCVPDYFIDNYMVEANGEYVKIYLYLLRCLSRTTNGFSISDIAEALDHTQKDIRKALRYWEDKGLLSLEYNEYDELNGIFLKEPFEDTPTSRVNPVYLPPTNTAPLVSIPAGFDTPIIKTDTPIISMDVVNSPNYDYDENLSEILYMSEKLIGHPFTLDAIETIISWHEDLHHSWELIEYIIDYSVERGVPNISYMNKVAISFHKDGIRTPAEAKQYSSAYLSTSFTVKNAFGINNRSLVEAELSYINRWSRDFGFSDEIIAEACHRTILKAKTASFEYADSILLNWNQNDVSSMEDIEALDRMFTLEKSKKSSNTTSYTRNKNFKERGNINFAEYENALFNS